MAKRAAVPVATTESASMTMSPSHEGQEGKRSGLRMGNAIAKYVSTFVTAPNACCRLASYELKGNRQNSRTESKI